MTAKKLMSTYVSCTREVLMLPSRVKTTNDAELV